ncbi:MAG: hypothetical protein JSR36_02485 [Proteobacteria bacterium]|nr:hypothetical protein [Pseudomonadota bacterium]
MGKTTKTEPPDRYARAFHERDKAGARIMPRVIRRAPRRGDIHPLSPDDIRNVLRAVPPSYVYGLKSVELVARPRTVGDPFGVYLGDEQRIRLYSCPPTHWSVEAVGNGFADMWLSWGAVASADPSRPGRVSVHWPQPERLWNFYLDTLFHELGHHYVRKYAASRGRPKTHRRNEKLADLHSLKIYRRIKRLAKR